MASALANRYAQALADVVTRPGAATGAAAVTAELGAFLAAFRTSLELRNVLLSPAVALARKKSLIAVLGGRLGLSRIALNFLYVVTEHRRLTLLGEMLAAFEALLDERAGAIRAAITTAQPASAEDQNLLIDRLSQRTGRSVRSKFSVDASLLGGAVVRIGSTIYDGSVKGRLAALERRLGAE